MCGGEVADWPRESKPKDLEVTLQDGTRSDSRRCNVIIFFPASLTDY